VVRDVDKWLTDLDRAGIGGRARQYARMVLGNALNDAMRLEMVERNVVALVGEPPHESEDFDFWDIDEALAFLAAARECRYYAFWVLWLTTGPRPNEMLGLRPEDVDLDTGTIILTKQLKAGGRGKIKTGRTARRTLPLTPIAIEALRGHRERMMAEGLRASP
jgi:integrase